MSLTFGGGVGVRGFGGGMTFFGFGGGGGVGGGGVAVTEEIVQCYHVEKLTVVLLVRWIRMFHL